VSIVLRRLTPGIYRLIAAGLILLVATVAANAQQSGAKASADPLLITFGSGAGTFEGDHDFRQLVRFSVPLSVSGKLYVQVFDADTGGRHDEAIGGFNTQMTYSLYGGGGTAAVLRDEDGNPVEVTGGKVLVSRKIGADRKLDGKWTPLFAVDTADGKVMGEEGSRRREFFLLVEGTRGNDGNVFDVRISSDEGGETGVEGAKLYSFLPTVRMGRHGWLTELRLSAPKDGDSLRVDNFDSARGLVRFAGRFRTLPLEASGQDEWQSSSVVLREGEKGELVSVTLGNGRELPNDASVYVTGSGDTPLALHLPPRRFKDNARPKLAFTQTPLSCSAVRFDAGGSSDPEGGALTYRWVFHDGSVREGQVVEHSYAQPGTYKGRLEVFDATTMVGNGSAADFDIFVKAPPTALFELPPMVALNAPFTLDGSTSQAPSLPQHTAIAAYEWQMGNGEVITNLATVRPGAGSTVSGENTAAGTANDSGAGNTSDASSGITTNTTDTGVSIVTAGRTTPSHAYTEPGTYTVALKVTDTTNHPCNTATATRQIHVNAPPKPNAGGNRRVALGQSVQFDASVSTDADGDTLAYSWNLGDGNTKNIARFEHNYAKPGIYAVKLVADDGKGVSNSRQSQQISVLVNAPPQPVIKVPTLMVAGQPAEFDAGESTDADGSVIAIEWLLDDGKTITRSKFRHAWFEPGEYAVTLKVTDNSGLPNAVSSITRTIKVAERTNEPPIAKSGGDRETVAGTVTRFDGSSSTDRDGSILTYNWDFGDGVTASGLATRAGLKSPIMQARRTQKPAKNSPSSCWKDPTSLRLSVPAVTGPPMCMKFWSSMPLEPRMATAVSSPMSGISAMVQRRPDTRFVTAIVSRATTRYIWWSRMIPPAAIRRAKRRLK